MKVLATSSLIQTPAHQTTNTLVCTTYNVPLVTQSHDLGLWFQIQGVPPTNIDI